MSNGKGLWWRISVSIETNGKVQINAFPHWDFALQGSVHAVRWNGSQPFLWFSLIQLLSREVVHLILIRRKRIVGLGYSCSIISVLLSKIFTWLPWFAAIISFANLVSKRKVFLFCDVHGSCWNSGWTGHFLCQKAMTVNLVIHWIGFRLWRKSGDTFKPFPCLLPPD